MKRPKLPLATSDSRKRVQGSAHTRASVVNSKSTHRATHQSISRQKPPKKLDRRPKRPRYPPHIFANDRLDERLWQLLDDGDPALRMYVYRWTGDRKNLPALLTSAPFPWLMDVLCDKHRGGDFYIMIRRGKKMELSGIISIELPLRFRQSDRH